MRYLYKFVILIFSLFFASCASKPKEISPLNSDSVNLTETENNNTENSLDQNKDTGEDEAYDFGSSQDQSIQSELTKTETEPTQAQTEAPPSQEPEAPQPIADRAPVAAPIPEESTQSQTIVAVPTTGTKPPARLSWLGLDYQKKNSRLLVEIITIGEPSYTLSQKKNQKGQQEIIISYPNTIIPRRLKRDIDSSEILGPLAYIRAREDSANNNAQIILTLREAVRPSLFADKGNMLITFPIPETYLGHDLGGDTPNYQATALGKDSLIPNILAGSQLPANQSPLPPPAVTPPAASSELVPSVPASENVPNQHGTDQISPKNSQSSNGPLNLQPSHSSLLVKLIASESFSTASVAADIGESDSSLATQQEASKQYQAPNPFAPQQTPAPAPSAPTNAAPMPTASSPSAQTTGQSDSKPMNASVTNSAKIKNSQAVMGPASSDADVASDQAYAATNSSDHVGSPQADNKETFHFRPVSIEFKNAPIKEVIRALSKENGVNFVFGEDVGNEKIDLNLRNVPWDQALQAVLETHALGMMKLDGGVIRIDKLETLDGEKKSLEKVRKSASLLIPTKVLVIRLSYSDAKKFSATVKDLLPSASYDPRVRVQADERTNSIIVEAIPADLEKIKTLIQRIDLQTPQVKIATRIVEIIDTTAASLGINWQAPQFDLTQGLGFGNLAFPNSVRAPWAIDTGIAPATLTNGDTGMTSIDFNLGSVNNSVELGLRLRMSETQQITKSLQNNSVIVTDNQKAKIEAGQELFFNITNGFGNAQLTSVKFTLNLEVTPHITADGSVQLDIKVENAESTKMPSGSSAQANKSIRFLETNMLRKSGETAVIGGLYTTHEIDGRNTVPFLGHLPLIGALFRKKDASKEKRELLIMVTPTILTAETQAAIAGDEGESQQTVAINSEAGVNRSANYNKEPETIPNTSNNSSNEATNNSNENNSNNYSNNSDSENSLE